MIQMPELAPFKALLILVTVGGMGLAIALAVYFWLTNHRSRVVWSAAGAAGLALVYAVLWLGSSLASEETILRTGERKYLCELDCHLGYRVERVVRSESQSGRTIWTITVGVLFDENTVSSRRSRETPLSPNPRVIYVEDEKGRVYGAITSEVAELWDRPLRPGESFSFDLGFDLPDAVTSPRLLISTGLIVDPFTIGHERAPFHKNIWFALEPVE